MMDTDISSSEKADNRVGYVLAAVIAFGFFLLLVLISLGHSGEIRQSLSASEFAESAQLSSDIAILVQRITLMKYGTLGLPSVELQGKLSQEIKRETGNLAEKIRLLIPKSNSHQFADETNQKSLQLSRSAESFLATTNSLLMPSGENSSLKELIVKFAQLNSETVIASQDYRALLAQDAVNNALKEEQSRRRIFLGTIIATTTLGFFVLSFVAHRVRKELQVRRSAERQLIEANRELEQFSSMVAHDLNGPLANLGAAAQILESKIKGSIPIAVEMAGTIRRETKRLHEMVNALLRLSRVAKTQIKSRSVTISDLVDTVRRGLLDKLDESGGKVAHEGIQTLWGDPALLENLFQNLVENSIRYSRKDTPPEVRLSVTKDETRVTIVYDDNGLGIPSASRNHIFEPFYQVPNGAQSKGLGLGLAIVQKIVRAHGGEISISEKDTPGTRFLICLPGAPILSKLNTSSGGL